MAIYQKGKEMLLYYLFIIVTYNMENPSFLGKAGTTAGGYLSEKFSDLYGKTESAKKNYARDFYTASKKKSYVGEFYSTKTEQDYFQKSLGVAAAFRSAKRFHDPTSWKIAISRFETLKREFSEDGAIAEDLLINIEAYQTTGDGRYAGQTKKDADELIARETGVKSQPEEQLLAASALLRLYEFLKGGTMSPRAFQDSDAENYRSKAEEMLGNFSKKNSGKNAGSPRLKNLAAMAYMDAHRITGKYEQKAREFFESSDKSLLLYSEAASTFGKKYAKAYKELVKSLPEPSSENVYATLNEPPSDLPSYFGRAATWFGRQFLRAGLPVAKTAVYGLGGVADYIGEGLEVAGDKLIEADYKKIGSALRNSGKGVAFLFGTETLKQTSIEIGGSGVLSIPGLAALGNASTGYTGWSGDLNYYEQNGGRFSDYHRYIYWGVNTPVASAGDSTFGFGTSINAVPYSSFYVDPRMATARIGLPNFLALWAGKVGANQPGQYARGPFTGADVGFGLFALQAFVYYPPLGPVVDYLMKKPAAWMRGKNDAILNGVKKLAKRGKPLPLTN